MEAEIDGFTPGLKTKMKLPFSLPFGKKEKPEYFLALLLRDEKVVAVIFEESLGKVKVIGKHEEYFGNSIEDCSLEELLETTDKAISIIEAELEEKETQKTVFGIKENWVQDLKIKREYLVKLKKLSEALGLAPIGFLVVHEAIAHLIAQEEGAPPSALLVEIDKQNITVSLVRAGRIAETRSTKIEESIPKTTDRILHHFTNYEVLPSRIIIFDSGNDEELVQEFINHSFSKSLPFLHVPQISTLPAGFDAKAVLFGAAREMGFELLEEKGEPKKEPLLEEKQEEQKEVDIGDFGFVREKDVGQKLQEQTLEIVEEVEEKEKFISEEKKEKMVVHLKKIIDIFTLFISKIPLKRVSVPTLPTLRGTKKLIFIPPLIVGILILILLGYIFGLRAKIILTVTPKNIEQNQDVAFSTLSSTDLGKGIIKTELVSVLEEGTMSTPTTGKKEVGDKATGTVTLYSRFTEEKTLPAQTVLTSTNGLKFAFDSSTKVASAPAGASASPTATTVKVTAKDIGKESNLPSGTKFSVGLFDVSDIEAKNETAFSGGSKKEVVVVAKEDTDKLTEELPKKLEGKAREDLTKKIEQDKAVLPEFTNISFTKKDFDKKVGDEASNVNLKATISFEGLAYQKSVLTELSKSKLLNRPDNMTISGNNLKTEVLNLKKKNEKEVSAMLRFTASLIPKIEEQKLKEGLTGKSFAEAKTILLKLPQVSSIEISLTPAIPFLPKILPYQNKNITITRVTK